MKRDPRSLLALFGASCLIFVVACKPVQEQDKPVPVPEQVATTSGADASIATPSTEGLQPQYVATLAEGISFAKPGYPEFIVGVSGVAGAESWGRWTDANLGDAATFQFKQALPQKFTLEIEGYAIGPNIDQPVKVVVGTTETSFKLGAAPAQTVAVPLAGVANADMIRLIVPGSLQPSAVDPSSKDNRKLGIALVSLKVKE